MNKKENSAIASLRLTINSIKQNIATYELMREELITNEDRNKTISDLELMVSEHENAIKLLASQQEGQSVSELIKKYKGELKGIDGVSDYSDSSIIFKNIIKDLKQIKL